MSRSVPNLKWIALHSNVIRGSQNIKIGSRDPGDAHLGVVLWSVHRWVRPLCLYQINFKPIALLVQKFLRGSDLEIRSRDPGHTHLWVVL